MKRIVALIAISMLMAACGSSGPQSGGSLTVPPIDPPSTTTSGPTTPASTVTTTVSEPADGSTTTTTTRTGASPDTTEAADQTPSSRELTVYFLDDSSRAIATRRTVTSPAVARAVVEALIAGPTTSESAAGLSTAFPDNSLLLGLSIADGTATVDMSREFESGGGSAAILGRLAQLVYSLTEFDSVESVKILLDGQEAEHFSGEGFVIVDPLTRAEFQSSVPLGPEYAGSGVDTWAQSDLPRVEESDDDAYRVVLVDADDILNVRESAGVEGALLGRLLPGTTVRATGATTRTGNSTWAELDTPAGPGWVNGFYLAPALAAIDTPGDPAAVVEELADRLSAGDDLSPVVSTRGLWVAHHSSPRRFEIDEVDGLLTDDTTYRWGSNALEPDSPELQPETFREAVAETFLSTFDDPDRQLLINSVVEGPNGRPPEVAIPTEFAGFPYVTVFDPGDDPQYGGLDWMSWVVSLSYEDGQLKVVGITIDEWAP